MGRQSRLRAERRRANGIGRPTEILRELFSEIEKLTHEHSRRVWEIMLEILADVSGVNATNGGCLTDASKKVLRDLPKLDSMLAEFLKSWTDELDWCKRSGAAITDPIGTIFEEAGCTNDALGQFFTPPSVIRTINSLVFAGAPSTVVKGLDPCCGSGRFALDALVHHDRLVMFNVDIDLWMMRAALVTFRYAQKFTHQRIRSKLDSGGVLAEGVFEEMNARGVRVPRPEPSVDLFVLGGRSWIIQADSLIVDLLHPDNWRYSWCWNPPPWQSTLKMDGFDGTYDEWRKSRPRKEVDAKLAMAAAAQPEPKPRVGIALDDTKLEQHLRRAMRDIDRTLESDPKRSALDGLVPVRHVPVLAGPESRLPVVRRRPP